MLGKTLRERLKVETAELHATLDHSPISLPFQPDAPTPATKRDVTRFFAASLGIASMLSPELVAVCRHEGHGEFEQVLGSEVQALERSLRALGMTDESLLAVPRIEAAAPVDSLAKLHGRLYVVFGGAVGASNFGPPTTARLELSNDQSSGFHPFGDRRQTGAWFKMWADKANIFGREHPASVEEAIEAACQSFQEFINHFARADVQAL